MNDNGSRVTFQEILGEAVKFAAFQDHKGSSVIVGQCQCLVQRILI